MTITVIQHEETEHLDVLVKDVKQTCALYPHLQCGDGLDHGCKVTAKLEMVQSDISIHNSPKPTYSLFLCLVLLLPLDSSSRNLKSTINNAGNTNHNDRVKKEYIHPAAWSEIGAHSKRFRIRFHLI